MNTTTSEYLNGNGVETATPELVITRVFNAPRQLVWDVWTKPEHITHWWGPKNFTAPFCRIDFRVGGSYLTCMRSSDGKDYWSTGVYREIVEPERIVATDSFADKDGNVVPASYYKMPGDMPDEMIVTVIFEEEETGKTKLTLRHGGMPGGKMGEMAEMGWNESLDKFADYVVNLNS